MPRREWAIRSPQAMVRELSPGGSPVPGTPLQARRLVSDGHALNGLQSPSQPARRSPRPSYQPAPTSVRVVKPLQSSTSWHSEVQGTGTQGSVESQYRQGLFPYNWPVDIGFYPSSGSMHTSSAQGAAAASAALSAALAAAGAPPLPSLPKANLFRGTVGAAPPPMLTSRGRAPGPAGAMSPVMSQRGVSPGPVSATPRVPEPGSLSLAPHLDASDQTLSRAASSTNATAASQAAMADFVDQGPVLVQVSRPEQGPFSAPVQRPFTPWMSPRTGPPVTGNGMAPPPSTTLAMGQMQNAAPGAGSPHSPAQSHSAPELLTPYPPVGGFMGTPQPGQHTVMPPAMPNSSGYRASLMPVRLSSIGRAVHVETADDRWLRPPVAIATAWTEDAARASREYVPPQVYARSLLSEEEEYLVQSSELTEGKVRSWLATIPMSPDGLEREWDDVQISNLVRFAQDWRLEDMPAEEIYKRYVMHQVELAENS